MRHLIPCLGIGLSIVLSACGRSPSIDPEIYPYVQEFMTAGHLSAIPPISILFGDLGNTGQADMEGMCRTGIAGAEIVLDRQDWDRRLGDNRKLLVFHELGHCVLGRSHKNDLDSDGHPVSIMYSDAEAVVWSYHADPAKYIAELFRP